MGPFKKIDAKETQRINRLQRDKFNRIVDVFEPPLPPGVPRRLQTIVKTAKIAAGEVVLDVGTGTGILVPLIQRYDPGLIYACDLSDKMLHRLNRNYSGIQTRLSDIRDLALDDACIDVVFINACYPNIVDKDGAFANLGRMMRPAGRMVISHPLGRSFVDSLKKTSPFPLDDFPEPSEAAALFAPYGFDVPRIVDEPELYLLLAVKHR